MSYKATEYAKNNPRRVMILFTEGTGANAKEVKKMVAIGKDIQIKRLPPKHNEVCKEATPKEYEQIYKRNPQHWHRFIDSGESKSSTDNQKAVNQTGRKLKPEDQEKEIG